jgi:hypothetical protein
MLGENEVTDALGTKVTAVPVVRAADLGTLQDPDNQGRTLELGWKQHCCRHNESHLGKKIQQYVGTKYVCHAGCPLGLR